MSVFTHYRKEAFVMSSEGHVVIKAKRGHDPAKPAVIFMHGRGSSAIQGMTPNYCEKPLFALAEQGHLILMLDGSGGGLLGAYNWGGPGCQTAITTAKAYLPTLGVTEPDIVLAGLSMGGLGTLKWLKDHPTDVKCTIEMIPAVDLSAHHDTPTGGAHVAEIEAAHTDLAGYSANVATYDPTASPGSYTGLPIKAWHGSDDTVAPTSWVTGFRTAVGGSAFEFQSLGAVGHNPQTINPNEVVTFVESNL